MLQLSDTTGAVAPQQKSVTPKAKPDKRAMADLAKRICGEHTAYVAATQAALTAVRSSLDHALRVGDLLIEAQQGVRHGEWENWVERNCRMSERTAQDYMRIARHREAVEAKARAAADLRPGIKAALKLIAKPSGDGAAPLPQSGTPVNEFVKPNRRTKHDLMAVWIETPADQQLAFLADVGAVFKRDADDHKMIDITPPPAAVADLITSIADDLSIPEFMLRRAA